MKATLWLDASGALQRYQQGDLIISREPTEKKKPAEKPPKER